MTNKDESWEKTPNWAIFLLIWKYCIIDIDLANKEVSNIALYSLFRSVPTFEFDSITLSCKAILACVSLYIPYLLERLESYQYFPIFGLSFGPHFAFPSFFKSLDG